MVRINVYIEREFRDYLNNCSGGLSENIRIAIREYVSKLQGLNVSASQSKKGGGSNG